MYLNYWDMVLNRIPETGGGGFEYIAFFSFQAEILGGREIPLKPWEKNSSQIQVGKGEYLYSPLRGDRQRGIQKTQP